jgi:hypothetical protein
LGQAALPGNSPSRLPDGSLDSQAEASRNIAAPARGLHLAQMKLSGPLSARIAAPRLGLDPCGALSLAVDFRTEVDL